MGTHADLAINLQWLSQIECLGPTVYLQVRSWNLHLYWLGSAAITVSNVSSPTRETRAINCPWHKHSDPKIARQRSLLRAEPSCRVVCITFKKPTIHSY